MEMLTQLFAKIRASDASLLHRYQCMNGNFFTNRPRKGEMWKADIDGIETQNIRLTKSCEA